MKERITHLCTKPDFELCMKRIEAWYCGDIIDRAPVRFSAHNAEYGKVYEKDRWGSLKERWFDVEYQLEKFERGMEGNPFLGETFPAYWPNLGPNAYPNMLGCGVEYGDVTTWAGHGLKSCRELDKIRFSRENETFKKLEELTRAALDRCGDRYIVGYTDIHPGFDCADAFRGTQELFLDLYDDPEGVKELVAKCSADFEFVFGYFNGILREHGHPSNTWINIPSFDLFHIPGPDLSAMLSNSQFREFILPVLKNEVRAASRVIFHMDGRGVAGHIDDILEVPGINAVQWVQGVGADAPIMQWIPLIKKIQAAGKGVVIDLQVNELEGFTQHVKPKGVYLCINSSEEEEQRAILKRLLKWK